jgi:hypothetical protein
MKVTVVELKKLIREISTAGSEPTEDYNHDLLDDSAFNSDSVYVPNDIKTSIKNWMKVMKLTKE